VSKPPGPPSIPPLIEPAGSKTNWSRLFAAPTRCSKPLKPAPPTVPVPFPVTSHVLSAAGPFSVSLPLPATSVETFSNESDTPPLTEPVPPSYDQAVSEPLLTETEPAETPS
jgi:hypothetical protein